MPNVNYPDLSKSFGNASFVGAQQDLENMFAAQRNEQLNQERARVDLDYDAARRPVELTRDALRLQNELQEADLIQSLYPGKKANALQKQKQEALSYDVPQVEKFGNGLLQLGTMAKNNGGTLPLWMKAQVPDELWKDLHSEGGADRFIAHGKAIIENKDKFISQESKQKSAEEIAAERAAAARYAADQRLEAARIAADKAIEKARITLSSKPTKPEKLSYQNYAVRLEQQADELAMVGKHEEARYLRERAAEYKEAALKFPEAAARVRTESQEGLETELGVRKPKQGKPADKPAQAPAANNNDRVRVINANGQTGTIPRSQLQDALSQGFKEIK